MTSGIWGMLVGQKVDRYRLERVLKTGGEGCVFLANLIVGDQILTKQYAVKLRSTNRNDFDRNFKELDAATKLNHPHLLGALTVGDWQKDGIDFLYLVMDLADGTLDDHLIQNSRLSKTEVLDVVKSIALALVYMHGEKPPILHRDLKPGNVMRVGKDWKLGDFGIARETNSQGVRLTSLMGTKEYAPPESYKSITSLPWDLWSLGVMIVEMLTGKLPFSNDTDQGLIMEVLKADPLELSKNLPAPFDEIVRGCLIKDPQERWTAQQVLEALSQPIAPRLVVVEKPIKKPQVLKALPQSDPWNILEEKYSNNEMLDVQVTRINNGGAVVQVLKLEGFIPQSHLVKPHNQSLVGQSLKVVFLEFKPEENRLVFSEKKAAFSLLKIGQIAEGRIVAVKDYGVFVEFNQLQGLLYIKEITGKYVTSIAKIFEVDQQIKAVIIKVDQTALKIDLSTKVLEDYPGEMLENMDKVMSEAEAKLPKARQKLSL
jgi:serine/threonine protein kinase